MNRNLNRVFSIMRGVPFAPRGVKMNGFAIIASSAVAKPIFVSAATSADGATVTITFSKAMANPSGKHTQFTVTVAGSGDTVTAATLNATTTKIDLTLTTAVTSGQTVTVAYTAGTVASADGGVLASFTAQVVTNNAVVLYQKWTTYPDSPVLTTSYPYQFLWYESSYYWLAVTTTPFFQYGTKVHSGALTPCYRLNAGTWGYLFDVGIAGNITDISKVIQTNNNIFTDNTYTTVAYAKTTT